MTRLALGLIVLASPLAAHESVLPHSHGAEASMLPWVAAAATLAGFSVWALRSLR